MSALFNFNSFLVAVLTAICTCTYIKMQFPAVLNSRTGFRAFFWKAARIAGNSSNTSYLVSVVRKPAVSV